MTALDATPTITAFGLRPDGGRGLARDTRGRWALEEAGRPYEVRHVGFDALRGPKRLALQPFGQTPTFEAGGLALFGTGRRAAHRKSPGRRGPGMAVAGLFAALHTVEPPIVEREMAELAEADRPRAEARLPRLDARIRDQLARHLGDAMWPDGAFSAGDLTMVAVPLRPTSPAARPAHPRADAAQRAEFLAAAER